MFGRLVNGKLQIATRQFKTEEGKMILNFNKSENKMKEFGFKEVIDIRPVFDSETQFLNVLKYNETEDTIEIIYQVVDKPEEPVVEPTPEEAQILELKERINSLEAIINQLTQAVATIPSNVNNEEE
jgi:hypothetical protein